jgi:hypothetical protein
MRLPLLNRLITIGSASAFLVATLSCGGDSSMSPTTLKNGSFSASIDGKAFTANLAIIATYANNKLSVTGTNAAETLGFLVVATGPGTYSVGSGNQSGNNASYVPSTAGNPQGWTAGTFNGSGSVKVDTLTSTGASGTFSFVLTPTVNTSATGNKNITNGKFNVTFGGL